jgi:hypothetical protein
MHVEPGRVACGRCYGGANRVGERRWHASRVRRRGGESLSRDGQSAALGREIGGASGRPSASRQKRDYL